MPTPITIVADVVTLRAELSDTLCARAIAERLPLAVQPETWGDEFYFPIPLQCGADETATRSCRVGDIGYWPPGSALCLFFGRTPMSTGPEPIPASAVNIVGRILDDATALRTVKDSRDLRLEVRRP